MPEQQGYVSTDIRALVQRILDCPRADSDVLLCLSDALVELAEQNDARGLAAHGSACRRLAAEIAEQAPGRARP